MFQEGAHDLSEAGNNDFVSRQQRYVYGWQVWQLQLVWQPAFCLIFFV